MQKHKLHPQEPCTAENCNICDGGLAYCEVCHGAEGAMPTECPGTVMTMEQSDDVYANKIDFIGGVWHDLAALNRRLGCAVTATPRFVLTLPVTLPPLLVRIAQRHYSPECIQAAKPEGFLGRLLMVSQLLPADDGTFNAFFETREIDITLKVLENVDSIHCTNSERLMLLDFGRMLHQAMRTSNDVAMVLIKVR